MIRVTPSISLRDEEVVEEFVRAPGPGGQNVNKVSTCVQLRFDAAGSPSLPEEVRERLLALAGARLTSSGEILITARRFRSRERNRQDAVGRLVALIREAALVPRKRVATAPTAASRERRISEKKRRGALKGRRGAPEEED
ncbi:MAG: alternative ribosome rescue aminoacyl-tRNA hydrolase ArfB [Acidobacteriota bacterium]